MRADEKKPLGTGDGRRGIRKKRSKVLNLRFLYAFSPHAPRPTPQRGFTFVELLLAAVMISVLVVGIGAHLRGGFNVWTRATSDRAHDQRIRVALEWIQRDFSGAFVYDPQESETPIHQFGSDSAQWVNMQKGTDQEFPSPYLINYRCDLIEGSSRLVRTKQTINAFLQDVEPPVYILFDDCETLAFLYAYKGDDTSETLDWRSEWMEQEIPKLIRVIIDTSDGGVIEHIMMNPAGILATDEIEES